MEEARWHPRFVLAAYATTHVAASAGGVAWAAISWSRKGKPTLVGTVTGVIAGLVAITPAAGYVSILSSILIGGIASFVCYYGIAFLKSRFKVDDTLDVFGIHGLGGDGGLWRRYSPARKSTLQERTV